MLRNLLKVTQQRFKPGFLCSCKTACVCEEGHVNAEYFQKTTLVCLDPGRKDGMITEVLLMITLMGESRPR